MTIRLQNLLVIPPIFLILGLAVGLLADQAARGEILWGLRQESLAVAATVGEMTGGASIDSLAAGDSTTTRRVLDALNQIARHGQVESVILYSQAKEGPVLAWHRDTTAVSLEPELWSRVRDLHTQTVLGEVRAWGPYPEAMAAAAPVYPLGGGTEPRGDVAVVIDASRMSSVTHDLRRDFAVLALLVTLIGVAAALFLSLRIGRQVRELSRVGATVAAGEYKAQVQVGGVKEVQDLSNILGTMASILSDVLTRGRRSLLIGDPYQLTQGMASAYREDRLPAGPAPDGLTVAFSPIGEQPPGCFHGWKETSDRVVLWVGEAASGDALDLAVEAAAANRALVRALDGGEPDAVASSVAGTFRLASLQIAWLTRPFDAAPETRAVVGTGAPVMKGDYCVLHSFQARHMKALSGSLSLFKDLSAEEAAREIPLALPQTFSGIVLLIRPSRPLSKEAQRDPSDP